MYKGSSKSIYTLCSNVATTTVMGPFLHTLQLRPPLHTLPYSSVFHVVLRIGLISTFGRDAAFTHSCSDGDGTVGRAASVPITGLDPSGSFAASIRQFLSIHEMGMLHVMWLIKEVEIYFAKIGLVDPI